MVCASSRKRQEMPQNCRGAELRTGASTAAATFPDLKAGKLQPLSSAVHASPTACTGPAPLPPYHLHKPSHCRLLYAHHTPPGPRRGGPAPRSTLSLPSLRHQPGPQHPSLTPSRPPSPAVFCPPIPNPKLRTYLRLANSSPSSEYGALLTEHWLRARRSPRGAKDGNGVGERRGR